MLLLSRDVRGGGSIGGIGPGSGLQASGLGHGRPLRIQLSVGRVLLTRHFHSGGSGGLLCASLLYSRQRPCYSTGRAIAGLTRRVIERFPRISSSVLSRVDAPVWRAGHGDDRHGRADDPWRRDGAVGSDGQPRTAVPAGSPAAVGREHGSDRHVVATDPAGAISGDDDRVRPVSRASCTISSST